MTLLGASIFLIEMNVRAFVLGWVCLGLFGYVCVLHVRTCMDVRAYACLTNTRDRPGPAVTLPRKPYELKARATASMRLAVENTVDQYEKAEGRDGGNVRKEESGTAKEGIERVKREQWEGERDRALGHALVHARAIEKGREKVSE